MKNIKKSIFMIYLISLVITIPCSITPLYATQSDTVFSQQIQSFDDLPQGLAHALTKALQDKISPTYSLKRAQSGFCATNTAHGMNLTFTDKGPRLTNKNNTWNWSMTLTGWGRGKSLIKTPLSTLTSKGPRMEYKRGSSLSEWYINTPWGLEQGFTVNNKPSTPKDLASSLILELTLSGSLQPALQGNTMLLSDSTGRTRIRYTGLYAFDAEGRTLPSHLALIGDNLRIMVDDSAASYPITIDPWVQKAKLTASDGEEWDWFGTSVAISGDTVVVGADDDVIGTNTDQGSAYVFVRSGDTWTQTAKLTASDGAADDSFGHSVAISGDTVVVGADGDDNNKGSAYVFEKPAAGWANMTQTAKLTASDGEDYDHFGYSVAISGDTVVVGAPLADGGGNCYKGSAYVFEKRHQGKSMPWLLLLL